MNNQQNLGETIRYQLNKAPTQLKVFNLLSDQKWHCRGHETKEIGSDQYAGGGGIQGLERGNKQRPGLVIETESRYCEICGKKTKWDRWTGEIKSANSAANIPASLFKRILTVYSYIGPLMVNLRYRSVVW
ncbi:hypothetical protein [Anabaena sp. CCY 0017]|uniref:hypothetical protein n=1 Tax=Anabaena sp. CCY 0017 TaxID=3103866 RepID=UPI0039C628DC